MREESENFYLDISVLPVRNIMRPKNDTENLADEENQVSSKFSIFANMSFSTQRILFILFILSLLLLYFCLLIYCYRRIKDKSPVIRRDYIHRLSSVSCQDGTRRQSYNQSLLHSVNSSFFKQDYQTRSNSQVRFSIVRSENQNLNNVLVKTGNSERKDVENDNDCTKIGNMNVPELYVTIPSLEFEISSSSSDGDVSMTSVKSLRGDHVIRRYSKVSATQECQPEEEPEISSPKPEQQDIHPAKSGEHGTPYPKPAEHHIELSKSGENDTQHDIPYLKASDDCSGNGLLRRYSGDSSRTEILVQTKSSRYETRTHRFETQV